MGPLPGQLLLLVGLLAALWVLLRLWRRQPGGRLSRFVLASLLVHVGLLSLLDLIVITVPVVEEHGERLRETVLKTFALGPSGPGRANPWDRPPDVAPPPESPAALPDPSPVVSRSVAPELRDTAPTISEALARTLPPGARAVGPAAPGGGTPGAVDAPPGSVPPPVVPRAGPADPQGPRPGDGPRDAGPLARGRRGIAAPGGGVVDPRCTRFLAGGPVPGPSGKGGPAAPRSGERPDGTPIAGSTSVSRHGRDALADAQLARGGGSSPPGAARRRSVADLEASRLAADGRDESAADDGTGSSRKT